METVPVMLPDSLRAWAQEQATRAGHTTLSEYIQQVLLREQERQVAQAEIEAKLVEGLDSGAAAPLTAEDWTELKRRVWERHAEGTES